MAYKGVFFDLYGTLVRFTDLEAAWDAWQKTFLESVRRHRDGIPDEIFTETIGSFFEGPIEQFTGDSLSPYEMRLVRYLARFEIELPRSQVREIAEKTVAGWHEFVTLDETAETVVAEIRKSKKTALVSNFDYPSFVHRLLERHRLDRRFDHITVSGDIGVEKPDPRIFAPALKATGLEGSEVIYLGDSREDIEGASKAGMKPVLIDREGVSDLDAVKIARLEEILDLLD